MSTDPSDQIDTSSTSTSDPLVEVKVNNPFSAFFNWIKTLIKNEGITINIKPLTAVAIAIAFTGGGGIIGYIFPHSSPLLHREVIYQGLIQRNGNELSLLLPNSDLYKLHPKDNVGPVNEGQALVKGNLTRDSFVIDISEITTLNTALPPTPRLNPISDTILANNQTEATSESSLQPTLPNLFTGIIWESTQEKALLFTSGKRRIEQQGVYLESVKLSTFPQDFINYYTQNLINSGFKQILNSQNPDESVQTFQKGELYFTFGIKSIFSGTGEKKQLSGYRAYIEHN